MQRGFALKADVYRMVPGGGKDLDKIDELPCGWPYASNA